MSTLNPDTQNAITEESRSLGHLDWFEVQEVQEVHGHIKIGEVDYFQVTLKVAFRLTD
jgi:flavin-binding protein dodecin